MDYIVRATAAEGQVRGFAITGRELVEQARVCHNSSPVVTAALGRLLMGGAMMGVMMKNDQDLMTIQIKGDGPLGGMTVTADALGHVKGYPNVPDVMLPANAKGKLDVGGAVGKGFLKVIKDLGLKEPYVGQVELTTGEIAEDLTYYFAVSEQVPSAVGLGVLMEKNNTVRQAGGFILQMMPYASEELVARLEGKLSGIHSVTDLLERGLTPEGILEELLGEEELVITDRIPAVFQCNCGKERIRKVLAGIGKKDLKEMIDDGKSIEVRCHFCNRAYSFSPEELRKILQEGERKQ